MIKMTVIKLKKITTHFLRSSPESRTYDKTYGLHYDARNEKLKIGKTPVAIINNNLQVQDKY